MSHSLTTIVRLLLLTILPLSAAAQDTTAAYRASEITPSIFLLRVPDQIMYDNVVVLRDSGESLIVDSGFMETMSTQLSELDRINALPVRYVVNTHFHHAGGNPAFADSATIVAHRSTRDRLSIDTEMYGMIPLEPLPERARPDISFDASITLHLENERVTLKYFPHAHTDGDVVAFFENANVVATGDLFVPGLGACDYANGCRWSHYLDALRRLVLEVPESAVIVPGHGRLSSHEDLEAALEMAVAMTEYVQGHLDRGDPLDELLDRGLPDEWKQFEEDGLPADFFLENLYRSLEVEGRD